MTDISSPDPVAAYLAEVRRREQAAPAGPWLTIAQHGRDIADEGWSEVRVQDASGETVALTYLSNVFEPSTDEDASEFIEAARSDVPRLLAAVEAVLARHQEHDGRCITCREHCTCVEDTLPEGGQMAYPAEMFKAVWDAWANCPHGNEPWPCQEYQDITRALLGEES